MNSQTSIPISFDISIEKVSEKHFVVGFSGCGYNIQGIKTTKPCTVSCVRDALSKLADQGKLAKACELLPDLLKKQKISSPRLFSHD